MVKTRLAARPERLPGRLTVVIPAYNEAPGITATFDALRAQQDSDFDVIVVDNDSTDETARVVRAYIDDHGLTRWQMISESQKGTGAAADTGMRAAIADGADLLARTDADCLPAADWTRAARLSFASGLDLVAGKLLPRTDDVPIAPWRARLLSGAVDVAAWFGRLRPGNRDDAYLGPYVMTAGCNMAITTDLYVAAGGFPRTAIEDLHEDRALVNAVRRLTTAYGAAPGMTVRASARRAHAWGLVRTLGWYADHRYRPEQVDIR